MTDKPSKSQIDKFKEAAKQSETDDSEEAFDRALRRVATSNDRETGSRDRATKK